MKRLDIDRKSRALMRCRRSSAGRRRTSIFVAAIRWIAMSPAKSRSGDQSRSRSSIVAQMPSLSWRLSCAARSRSGNRPESPSIVTRPPVNDGASRAISACPGAVLPPASTRRTSTAGTARQNAQRSSRSISGRAALEGLSNAEIDFEVPAVGDPCQRDGDVKPYRPKRGVVTGADAGSELQSAGKRRAAGRQPARHREMPQTRNRIRCVGETRRCLRRSTCRLGDCRRQTADRSIDSYSPARCRCRRHRSAGRAAARTGWRLAASPEQSAQRDDAATRDCSINTRCPDRSIPKAASAQSSHSRRRTNGSASPSPPRETRRSDPTGCWCCRISRRLVARSGCSFALFPPARCVRLRRKCRPSQLQCVRNVRLSRSIRADRILIIGEQILPDRTGIDLQRLVAVEEIGFDELPINIISRASQCCTAALHGRRQVQLLGIAKQIAVRPARRQIGAKIGRISRRQN